MLHQSGLQDESHYGLGTTMEVYDAELFGIECATKKIKAIMNKFPQLRDIYLFTDNQAAILSTARPNGQSGQRILGIISRSIDVLHYRGVNVTL